MQRVWTVVLSTWAMLAIVAGLAWAHRAPAPLPKAVPQTLVVKGAHGKRQLVLVQPSALSTHVTTSTSGVVR